MRKIAMMMIVLMGIGLPSIAQEESKTLYYRLKTSLRLYESDFTGKDSLGLSEELPANSKFTIVNTIDNGYIIRFWQWGGKNMSDSVIVKALAKKDWPQASLEYKLSNFNYKADRDPNKQHVAGHFTTRYFKISEAQMVMFAEKLQSHFEPTYGALVIPIKVRFDPSEFTKDVTFSATGGIKWNVWPAHKLSLTAILGTGISAITVDSTNTGGTVTSSTDRAGITFFGGLVLQWKMLQIGAFTGGDWLMDDNKDKWRHHGKPWLGVGIGISLYTIPSQKGEEGGN